MTDLAKKLLGVPPGGVQVQAAPAAQPAEEETYPFTINVPKRIPVDMVKAALAIGESVQATVMSGKIVICFPAMQPGPDGKKHPAMGKKDVPIADPKDIERFVMLADAHINANARLANAKNPSDQLSAKIDGDRHKDNALRDVTAKAEGQPGGIILAK